MRNEPVALNREEAARAYALQAALEECQAGDKTVSLTYTKRDGQSSGSVGKVRFFNGREGCDTMSVTLETDTKGMRTINLCRIVSAKVVTF